MQIRKVAGNKNYHIVNIPQAYCKALGLNFGDYIEIYSVKKLFLVMKKYSGKPIQGIAQATAAPPDDV